MTGAFRAAASRWRDGFVRQNRLEAGRAVSESFWMTNHSPLRYFKTSPEVIRLAVMMWSAPTEWSKLIVSAWSVFGLSVRRFLALAGGNPKRCAA